MKSLLSWCVSTCLWTTALAQERAGAPVAVAYREPADRFEILDNVSAWWPGYTDDTYREYWVGGGGSASPGLSADDETLFERYAEIRTRYFDRSGQEDEDPRTSVSGLFTDRRALSADPLAFAFYRSESMDEAFERAAGVVEPGELEFLRKCFEHFAARLDPLVAETRQSVAASLARTRKTLEDERVRAYVDDIRAFFGVEDALEFTALYVWWPDAERIQANPNGPYLLLRVRPNAGETIDSADVVVHEAVHVLSALQPVAQKRATSDALLAASPDMLDGTARLEVLEEPLATVLGNMEFRRRFDPKRFSWGRQWYGKSGVDLSARVLYPAVMDALANGGRVGGAFTKDAAALCAVVRQALHPPPQPGR
jgi:hypothetical protein